MTPPNDKRKLPEWYDEEGCDGYRISLNIAAALKIAWDALDEIRNREHYSAGLAMKAMNDIEQLK